MVDTLLEEDNPRPTKRRIQLRNHLRKAGLFMHDKRLWDILPQPVPPLPPAGLENIPIIDTPGPLPKPCIDNTMMEPPNGALPRVCSPVRHVLNTARNSFGLFQRYLAQKFPSHNPDGDIQSPDLSDIVDVQPERRDSVTPHAYGPFPNKSSFLLGDWYWNWGAQKSQKDFKALIDIVATDDFQPSDVQEANWDKINTELLPDQSDTGEWMDDIAGWKETPVPISVPFHHQTDTPSIQEYSVANLHHRPLVSVIRERSVIPTLMRISTSNRTSSIGAQMAVTKAFASTVNSTLLKPSPTHTTPYKNHLETQNVIWIM
jgi:hypothetical protein